MVSMSFSGRQGTAAPSAPSRACAADLEGLGAIVVSARSAFYDLEFLGGASSPANQADISITTIGLEPWTDEQLMEYLTRNGTGDASTVLDRLSEADRQLLRRPFFASQFPRFAERVTRSSEPIDLLDYLIAAYLGREAEKIVDSSGEPVLPVDGHRRLFELTASEMWEAEARQLPVNDLRTLTEVVAESLAWGLTRPPN
jgi:hypothetical protein